MDIRIDLIPGTTETIICIAGRLTGTAIAELNKACDPIENSLVIDLSSLVFADEDGLNAIHAIVDKGAQVHGASPFVQLLLDSVPEWKPDAKESKPS